MFYDYWSCCGDYLTGYQLEIQALHRAGSELLYRQSDGSKVIAEIA